MNGKCMSRIDIKSTLSTLISFDISISENLKFVFIISIY